MTNQNAPQIALTMDALVEDLLGLDPQALSAMGGKVPNEGRLRGRAATSQPGLNRFMRRVLALCLALENAEGVVVRLKTEQSARANGWPDAKTANTAMVLVWALLFPDRELKGLPHVPLLLAGDPASEPLDPTPDADATTEELVRRCLAGAEITAEMGERRRRGVAAPSYEGNPVPSGNDAIRELLGLEPKVLASVFDTLRDEPGAAYASDPERAGRAGLDSLVRDALLQYCTMKRRDAGQVRLMTELDAKEGRRPDAKSANFATLLSCGLLCEGGWEVDFVPPRARLAEEEDVLRRVARHAYFHGSPQAFAALELLCDDDVHFGTCRGFTMADLLFQSIGKQHDPDGKQISARPFGLQLKAMTLGEGLAWMLGTQAVSQEP